MKITLLNFLISISFIVSLHAQKGNIINFSGQKILDRVKVSQYVDSLKEKLIKDTVKFSNKDLIHTILLTQNIQSYSPLFVINRKYRYVLDIVDGSKMTEFIHEFLRPAIIKSIRILNSTTGTAVFGSRGQHGVIFIETSRKEKIDYHVAGLEGNAPCRCNFDQYREGSVRIVQ
jgi:hypothetical protein